MGKGVGRVVVVMVGTGMAEDEEGVGEGVETLLDVVVVVVMVIGSLQPNQPGVSQVEVLVVLVEVVVVSEVVVSSLQPHHPGVWHVVVRVAEVVVLELEEVVVSVPLLSKYFQLKQSTHSVSCLHSGRSSYARMTLSITLWTL